MIAARGATDRELAVMFGLDPISIQRWRETYTEFDDALSDGRTMADARVTRALFERAVGYSHPEEKIFQWDGEIITHDTIKHYAPDVNAIKLWLTNRQKDAWKDRVRNEHTGSKDGPIAIRQEDKVMLMASILALIEPKSDDEGLTIDNTTGSVS